MITITLPWPAHELSPNARAHWAVKAKLKAAARQEAHTLAYGQAVDMTGDIPLTLEFCPPSRRRFDRDNALASCKAQLDGVAEALGVDDSRFEPITLRRGPVCQGGKVVLKIGN